MSELRFDYEYKIIPSTTAQWWVHGLRSGIRKRPAGAAYQHDSGHHRAQAAEEELSIAAVAFEASKRHHRSPTRARIILRVNNAFAAPPATAPKKQSANAPANCLRSNGTEIGTSPADVGTR